MPGVVLHPQPCVRIEEAHKLKSLQVSRNKRHSLRDGVNAYLRALPGVHDLLVTVASKIITCRLGTSPGVPGPHAFAVRVRTARLSMRPRPSHPASRLVTIAMRPSYRGRMSRGDHRFRNNGS